MNLNLSNGWGIVRTIIDVCLKQPDGTYLLIKDRKCYMISQIANTLLMVTANKQIVRLYLLPAGIDED